MQIPLFVRENALLPISQTDDRPDYDYHRGLTLHLSQLQDRVSTSITVPNNDYTKRATFVAERNGRQLALSCNIGIETVQVRNLGGTRSTRYENCRMMAVTEVDTLVEWIDTSSAMSVQLDYARDLKTDIEATNAFQTQ